MREARSTVIVKGKAQTGTEQSFVDGTVNDPGSGDKISKIV
jgi:hypothetical protein